MSITSKDVQGLREGDVVEITDERWPEGTVLRGPVYLSDGELRVGHIALATRDGRLFLERPRTFLTVVSRAPRPLYVNHPRTEPVPGDVVRAADGDGPETWHYVRLDFGAPWGSTTGPKRTPREHLPARLHLLVDGETGQVVQ